MESSGVMNDMTARLADDAQLAIAYRQAHESTSGCAMSW